MKMSEEEKGQKTDTNESQDKEWDQKRQHRDEINAAKKREDDLKNQLIEKDQEIEEGQTKISEQDDEITQLKVVKPDVSAENAESGDLESYEQVVSHIKKQDKEIAALKEDHGKIAEETKAVSQHQRIESGNKLLADLLTKYDSEIGPFREKVLPQVNDWFRRQGINKLPPQNQKAASESKIQALYLEQKLMSRPEPDTVPPVTDTLEGGVSVIASIQEGSFDEVEKQMLQKGK